MRSASLFTRGPGPGSSGRDMRCTAFGRAGRTDGKSGFVGVKGMNPKWQYRRIGDVCIVERGGSPRPIESYITDEPNGINWIKIGDTSDSMFITQTAQRIRPEGMKKSRYVQPGDFLLSNSMSFGRPYILKIDGCIHDGWLVLRDRDGLFDKRFLYYYLSARPTYEKFRLMAVGGVVNNLNSDMVRSVSVPIPDINEQVQIADLLDRINKTVSMRKQQLRAFDTLIKARFVEMFGDPVSNPKNWPVRPLLDMGDCKNGMNFHYDDSGVDLHCLGVGDFQDHSIIADTSMLTMVSLNELPSDEYMLRDDDIVFVRSNGNKALVGRCVAVYPGNVPTTFSGFCIRYRKRDMGVTVPFLLRVLKTDTMRAKMAGRGANIQNLNQQILGTLIIPVPPLALQEQFSSFVSQVDKSKSAVQQALDKAQLLFDSLMQEYFG